MYAHQVLYWPTKTFHRKKVRIWTFLGILKFLSIMLQLVTTYIHTYLSQAFRVKTAHISRIKLHYLNVLKQGFHANLLKY